MSALTGIKPELANISYKPDPVAPSGRVGLITLATDFNSEDDLRRILPTDIGLFTTRIANANPITVDSLRAMADDLPRAARTILPGFGVDVAIFGCTSGTAVNGSARIEALINEGMPDCRVTNPLLASHNALQAVGAQKIAIVAPYILDVTATVAHGIADAGFELTNVLGFGLENDPDMTAIPPDILMAAAIKANSDDADAIFISCTAIRAAEIAQRTEQLLGKPVITSNQALIWHALGLMNYQKPVTGFGSLFDHTPPTA